MHSSDIEIPYEVKLDQKLIIHFFIAICQENGHISATGKIDDDTVNLMRQPRCGVPDNFHLKVNHHRQKRYDTLTTKWHSLRLTWRYVW